MVNIQETHTDLIKRLQDPHEADVYFSSVLEKCKNLDKDEADTLLHQALENIAKARPEDVHVDISNKNSLKMRALTRLLHFISRKFM